MQNSCKRISLHFVGDSEVTLSLETVNSMQSVLGLHSLEALISYALIKLKNDLKITYPLDDGLPSADHLAAIEQFIPQDTQFKELLSLFDKGSNEPLPVEAKEYNLSELLSQVNEENVHEHNGMISSLDMKVNDIRIQNSNFHYVDKSLNESSRINKDEYFTIQISLESAEQVHLRWLELMRAIDNGESVNMTKRLSFEDWEDLLSVFSERGREIVEALRKGQ